MFSPDVEMMKKYTTKQTSEQDEGVKAEHQIIRQQSNSDATVDTPPASKKEKDKEAEEEVNNFAFNALFTYYCLPAVIG